MLEKADKVPVAMSPWVCLMYFCVSQWVQKFRVFWPA